MLSGFLSQSAPQAPPAMGGDLSAPAGADATACAGTGDAFCAALESACDAKPAGTPSSGQSQTATTPGRAAWLLALALGAEVPLDADTTQEASARPDNETDLTLPVTSDDDESKEKGEQFVVAPVIEAPFAMQTTAVATAGISEAQTGEAVTGSVAGRVAGNAAQMPATDHVTDTRPGTEAASGQRASDPGIDRHDDVVVAEGRHERSHPVDSVDVKPEPTATAQTQDAVTRTGDGAPVVEAPETGRQESTARSDGPARPDAPKAAGQRKSAAPPSEGTASTNAAQPEAAATSAARAEVAAAIHSEGSRGATADAAVDEAGSGAGNAGGARPVQKPVDVRNEPVPGGSGAAVATTASAAAHGSADSLPQRNDADAPGQRTGFEMAVRRTAATAMLTLVASADGTLRLTPAAHITPMVTPLLPEEHTVNIESMVQTMRVMVTDKVSEATVHLRPEHFGDVRIQVRIDGKAVTAIIHTDSSRVREWLQGQESSLRNSLSEQGLQLERLMVQRDGRQDRRDAQQEQQAERRRPRPRPAGDAQQTFEITV
jgi:flagellar hook-length control protein FliK